MIRKISRLENGYNLLPADKSKYTLATLSNCATCETPFNEHHLLVRCESLELFQTNLKTMITNTLYFHYQNFLRITLELLLGEGGTSLEVALEIRYFCWSSLVSQIYKT